jgi:hypothetical protein
MMKSEKKEPKLFKVSGMYVKDFYLVAHDEEEAAQDAKRGLAFRVTECKLEETGWFPGLWKQLRGK